MQGYTAVQLDPPSTPHTTYVTHSPQLHQGQEQEYQDYYQNQYHSQEQQQQQQLRDTIPNSRPKMDIRRQSINVHALPTRLEKLYMAIAAFEALVVLGMAFAVFALIEANIKEQNAKVRTVPVYLAISIMAQIFSVLYVFDALRARNIVQLGLHLFFNICILVYSILEIPQTKNAMEEENFPNACGDFQNCTGPDSLFNLLQKLYIVVPIILGLASIAFAAMIRALYIQFGWAVFHLVGASPEMKRMHRAYQTLISLLKLLLFFALAFCLAFLILVTAWDSNRAEFIITIIALPLVVLCMFACGWALRVENKPVMGGCLVLMVAGLVYFIYKLASLWLPRTAGLYSNTKITMAIFSIFAIIILMVTFVNGCVCMSNSNKGLIQTHQNPENKTSLWSLPANARFEKQLEEQPITEPERMVID